MELIRKKRVKVTGSNEFYPHDLQLYLLPPTSTISLADFEEWALDRLRVLRIIEQVFLRTEEKSLEVRKTSVVAELKKHNLKTYAKLMTSSGNIQEPDMKARLEDHTSHFILRLVYCRSDTLKRWFVSRELELFRLRFHSLSTQGARNFLEAYNLKYSPISEEDKNHLKDSLVSSTPFVSHTSVEIMDFFKVPFTDVLDLIRGRKVYLSAGFAYIPNSDLVSVITTIFKKYLIHGLANTFAALPHLEEDERLNAFLGGLHNSYVGESFTSTKEAGSVSVGELDSLSQISFPPCMRQTHEFIRSTHHSKHGGRMQYGLFIKGIGLTLEDSMRFWKEEFTKRVDPDKFDKQYAYTIRHNYGKEGKLVSYSPYSCMKIITGSIGPGDCHGCPFKHNSQEVLKQKLQKYNIPALGAQVIMDYVSQHHYQIACTKYFELTHNTVLEEAINHPNQYFEMSRKILSGKHETKKEKGIKSNEPSSHSVALQGASKSIENDPDVWGEHFDLDVSAVVTEAITRNQSDNNGGSAVAE